MGAELRAGLQPLGESFAVLAVGFATLAVPLALSARSTACTFALEGAALVWLGFRQQRRLPRWTGYAHAGRGRRVRLRLPHATDPHADLNGQFVSAVLIALGGGVSACLLSRRPQAQTIAFLLWGWAWWWFACGARSVASRRPSRDRFRGWLVIAITGAFGASCTGGWTGAKRAWPAFARLARAAV